VGWIEHEVKAWRGASRRIIRFELTAVAPDESGSDLLLDSHAFTHYDLPR
jgi:hypothetical protein